MGLFKSKTSFIPRKNRNGTTTAGQYSQYGISQSSNGGTSSQKEDLSDIYKRLEEKLDSNKVGTANGAASLDENGKVPTDQLPSYVDDVVEYETLQDFPSPGETGKIYISTSTNKTYRWSGSQYIDISSASDDCLLKSSKISDNEIGTIVAGGDVTSADNYLNNRGLKSLWAYITAAANDIVANLSTMIAAKQDAISVTTKSDTPTGNDTVIMQANGTNNTKTFLRRELSDLWNFFKTQEYPEAYLGWGGKHISGSFAPVDAALVDVLGANRTAIYPANCIDILYSRDKGNTWIDYGASDSIKRRLFSTGVSSNDIVIGKSTSEEMADENSMLRIIFKSRADGSSSNVLYAQLKKFAIYVSTNGSNGVKCTVDALRADRYDSGEDNWTIFANEAPISGWSGWNIINLGNTLTTAGNDSQKTGQYRYVRFTFSNTSRTGTSKGLSILRIYSYGLNCWNAPNSLATRGTLYNYDDTQNATFPAKIYVQNSANNEVYYKGGTDVSVADGGTGASTAIGAEYNILNQVQDTDVAIDDNRKIALCNQTKSSTAGVFRWLKMSNVWTYIKGKIDAAYSSVLGSGITSSKVSSYDTHIANGDIHVTNAQKNTWNNKQDAITITTQDGEPAFNDMVIMQPNGTIDNKTFQRRKMSDFLHSVVHRYSSNIYLRNTHGRMAWFPASEWRSDNNGTYNFIVITHDWEDLMLHCTCTNRVKSGRDTNSDGSLKMSDDNISINVLGNWDSKVVPEEDNEYYNKRIYLEYSESEDRIYVCYYLPSAYYTTFIDLSDNINVMSVTESINSSNKLYYPNNRLCARRTQGKLNIKLNSTTTNSFDGRENMTLDLSNFATKSGTIEYAKKAAADDNGDSIYDNYLNLNRGGTLNADLSIADGISIRTYAKRKGNKLLAFETLQVTEQNTFTGRNLIGVKGISTDKIQTVICSGDDLVHRKGNDDSNEDFTIIDTSNAERLLGVGRGLDHVLQLPSEQSTMNARYMFSVDISQATGSYIIMCYVIEFQRAISNTYYDSTQMIKVKLRKSSGVWSIGTPLRKIMFGTLELNVYYYYDSDNQRVHFYADDNCQYMTKYVMREYICPSRIILKEYTDDSTAQQFTPTLINIE